MDEQAQNPAPETEAPVVDTPVTNTPAETEAPAATVAPVVEASAVETPTEPDAQAPETEAPAESEIAHLESAVVAVSEEALQAFENVVHAIEQRSFGRPSADNPVIVTTVLGGQ